MKNRFFSFIHNDKRVNTEQKSKLRTYRCFKSDYKIDAYLETLHDRKLISAVAKFRLSNHDLLIEKGRHSNMPVSERLCPFGCKSIEDEEHFFSSCKINGPMRDILMVKLNQRSPLNIIDIMKSCDVDIIVNVACFIRDSFNIRKASLNLKT